VPKPATLRIYLTGRLVVESGDQLLDAGRLPGKQGRLAFAYLVNERKRPVPRDELAEVLWGEQLPPAWETALRAVVSKLRSALAAVGIAEPDLITGALGCYQVALPAHGWIDTEAAASAIHEAETALRSGRIADACGPGLVAAQIARRPFLPGEEAGWIGKQRAILHAIHLRALETLVEVWLASADYALAVRDAEEAINLEPYRETSYQQLMRVRAAAGDRAGALAAYERLRELLANELGVDPSPETVHVNQTILRLGQLNANGIPTVAG
jgi:DNA-binding SARP family transcriptional activator